jgi:hypothetical protein
LSLLVAVVEAVLSLVVVAQVASLLGQVLVYQ